MKATRIYYEELRTTGQYNNQKLGVELEIEEGEKAQDVLHKAQLFVKLGLSRESISPQLVEGIVRSMKDAQRSMEDLVSRAQDAQLDSEIPF